MLINGGNMKEDFVALFSEIEYLKKCFAIVSGVKTIRSNEAFSAWKQEIQFELQEIYNTTNDKYIWSTLTLLKQGFNGWNDEVSFNELSGSLLAIKKNINKYYDTGTSNNNILENNKGDINMMQVKETKLFISHSSEDVVLVNKLVDLLESIGMNHKNLFCSSIPGYGIPLGEDIYEYLKSQFHLNNLHVLYVLSDNYYSSPACLNEMGAAWVLKTKETTVLAPKFDYREIRGAINPRKIGLKLDDQINVVKERLGNLKNDLIEEFGLNDINDPRWELKRDKFIDEIAELSHSEPKVRQI